MARRPNLTVAGIELGLIVASLAAGRVFGHWAAFAVIAAGALTYWILTRAGALSAMSAQQKLIQGGVAVAMLLVILGGAFLLGLAWRGPT